MTAFERVTVALGGGKPDRVPFVPKIWVDYAAAQRGVDLKDIVENPVTALEVLLEAAADLGVDGVRQFPFPRRRTAWTKAGELSEVTASGRKVGRIDLAGGLHTLVEDPADYRIEDESNMVYFHYRTSPEPAVPSAAAARRIAVPDARLFDELGWRENQEAAVQAVPAYKATADLAPALIQDCGPIGLASFVAFNGMQRGLFDLFDNPELVHAVLDKTDQIAVVKGRYWLDRGFRVLRINDSAGNMSVMSPDHWREYIKPHFAAVAAELHRHAPDALLYCHICGNVLPIVADLAETGLDCIAPLDPLGGFTVAEARGALDQAIGLRPGARRPALMGGINTLSFVDGSPESIAAEARACINGAAFPGEAVPPAGFVLGSGCVVPRGAREDLIRAVVDAVASW